MKSAILRFFSCPACGGSLQQTQANDEPEDSELRCGSCARTWPVRNGIPDLTFPDDLREEDARSRKFWDRTARLYDRINQFTGFLRAVSIPEERRELIERLSLRADSVVLEVATGTGRNLEFLVNAVGETGAVFGLDLSVRMLDVARQRVEALPRRPQLALGNSQHLPFTDGVFDAVLDGAGIKYYADKGQAMREMLRVVRPGGKVLVTELGMPSGKRPSLRQRLLLSWIPGFREGPPRDAVPTDASDIQLSWDAAETFYALEFRRSTEREQ